jgi:cytochrome b involved in lipid metabolism
MLKRENLLRPEFYVIFFLISPETFLSDTTVVIVVDDIVYDCTDFILDHPGGTQVIEASAGGERSWQFWRFHGSNDWKSLGQK